MMAKEQISKLLNAADKRGDMVGTSGIHVLNGVLKANNRPRPTGRQDRQSMGEHLQKAIHKNDFGSMVADITSYEPGGTPPDEPLSPKDLPEPERQEEMPLTEEEERHGVTPKQEGAFD